MEGRSADDWPGALVLVARVWLAGGDLPQPGYLVPERAVSPRGDENRGLVLECAQSHGSASHSRHRSRLQPFHATGLAAAWRQSGGCPSLGGARVVALRRRGGGGLRFTGLFQ